MKTITIYLEVEDQRAEANFDYFVNLCALELISANRETLMIRLCDGEESDCSADLPSRQRAERLTGNVKTHEGV